MPLPWKKAKKYNRITQLVAEHLNSPKHGGSLVVETGFPTSLVDLFVKNRDRLKKSMKRSDSTRKPLIRFLYPLVPQAFCGSHQAPSTRILHQVDFVMKLLLRMRMNRVVWWVMMDVKRMVKLWVRKGF